MLQAQQRPPNRRERAQAASIRRTRSNSGEREREQPPQVLTVCPGGSGPRQFSSIEAAWAAVLQQQDGIKGFDPVEIRVLEGVYVLDSRLILQVKGRTVSIVGHAYGECRVVLLSESRARSVVLIRGSRARVTLRNLEIMGPVLFSGMYSNWKLAGCNVDGRGSIAIQVDPKSECCRLRVLSSRLQNAELQHGIVVTAPNAKVEVELSEIISCNNGLRVGGSSGGTLEVVDSRICSCKTAIALLQPIPNAGGSIERNSFVACSCAVEVLGAPRRALQPTPVQPEGGALHYATTNLWVEKEDNCNGHGSGTQPAAVNAAGPGSSPSASSNQDPRLHLLESCLAGKDCTPPPDVMLHVYPPPGTDTTESSPADAVPPVKLRAHSVFLQMHSEYLGGLFKSGMQEAQTQIVPVNDFQAETVRALLRFFYTEKIDVGIGTGKDQTFAFLELIRAADYFKVRNLASALVKQLKDPAVIFDGAMAVRALCRAEEIHSPELRALALERAGRYRREVVRSEEFRELVAQGQEGRFFNVLLLLCDKIAIADGSRRLPDVDVDVDPHAQADDKASTDIYIIKRATAAACFVCGALAGFLFARLLRIPARTGSIS